MTRPTRLAIDALWRLGLHAAYRALLAWWWLRQPEMDGAHVAVWWDDQLLLIRNSYRRGVLVPSGGIGRRETPLAAAIRELREEVGLEVNADELRVAATVLVDFEHKRDRGYFFELHCDFEPDLQIDRREVVWAGFVPASRLADEPLVPHVRAYLDTLDPLNTPGSLPPS